MEIGILISIISVSCAVIVAYTNSKRYSRIDTTSSVKMSVGLEKDVAYIKEGINDIKEWQNEHDDKHEKLIVDIAILQRDLKSAWRKIDDAGKQ